jgi:chlorophyll synthase
VRLHADHQRLVRAPPSLVRRRLSLVAVPAPSLGPLVPRAGFQTRLLACAGCRAPRILDSNAPERAIPTRWRATVPTLPLSPSPLLRFDRELDAINEPYRPIPSGAISEAEVYSQIAFLLIGGGVLAYQLDGWAGNDWPVITAVAAFGSFMAYIYSAPPLKLKAEGWLGTYALGSSYIALPWWCGHAMFNAGSIGPEEVILTILYSIAGLGIAIVNDFKSIEGDKALGMNSLPVAFGVDTAKWICVGSIDATQLGVAAYLYAIGEPLYAAILFGLVLPQMYSQISFIQDPVANDVKYQAAAQPFLVFGILTTALAVGHHTF